MAPAEPPHDPQVRDQARTAWSLGIAAIILVMLGPCMYYLPFLAAIPLALLAMMQARAALASPKLDGASQVYAQTGQVNAVIALAWSVFVLAVVALVIVLYIGFFAFAIALGSA